jgi:hypothetical protein
MACHIDFSVMAILGIILLIGLRRFVRVLVDQSGSYHPQK